MPSTIKRVPETLSLKYSEVERAWDGMIPQLIKRDLFTSRVVSLRSNSTWRMVKVHTSLNSMASQLGTGMHFEELPLEVRWEIYKQLRFGHRSIYVPDTGGRYAFSNEPLILANAYIPGDFPRTESERIAGGDIEHQKDVCNILCTSKKIYAEAAPMYYGGNTFKFSSCDALAKFAFTLTSDARWLLTKVFVRWTGRATAKAAKALLSFPRLKELNIKPSKLRLIETEQPEAQQAANSFNTTRQEEPRELEPYSFDTLLRIKGLKTVNMQRCSALINGEKCAISREEQDMLQAKLQALTEPHDPQALKRLDRLEKKDFGTVTSRKPKKEAVGVANVLSKAERKLYGLMLPDD